MGLPQNSLCDFQKIHNIIRKYLFFFIKICIFAKEKKISLTKKKGLVLFPLHPKGWSFHKTDYMDKDNRNLLLQDLSSRIPYGVKVAVNQSELKNYDYKWKNWSFDEEPQEIDGVSIYGVTFGCMDMSDGVIGFEYIKPYLFPLSSMSEEQRKYISDRWGVNEDFDFEIDPNWGRFFVELGDAVGFINWCYKNHFDYRGLIPKGLAKDATNLNIY